MSNKPYISDPFLYGEWFGIQWFQSCYVEGHVVDIKKWLGYGPSLIATEQVGDVQRIFMSKSEWKKSGQRCLAEIIVNPAKMEKVMKNTRLASDQLNKYSAKLEKTKFDKLNKKQLVEILKQYHKYHHAVWVIGMVPNVLELENSFLTDYLKKYLRGNGLNENEVIDAFRALTTPRELSAAQKEEREMLKLVSNKTSQIAIKKHWQKFYWLQFGWKGPGFTLDYFIDIEKRLRAEGKAKVNLTKILMAEKKMAEARSNWQARLNLPIKFIRLARLLEEIFFIKAYRMDAIFRSLAAIQPLLKIIAQQNYLSLDQMYTLYPEWLIKNLQQGKFDVELMNRLNNYSVRYWKNKSMQYLVGEDAKNFVLPINKLLPPVPVVDFVKGECAFPGLVKGVAKIINKASEKDKFNEGDILVSNVTDPSLVPIMNMAAAFVTNSGGLTCHAAIIARELEVPCVIGTKIATRIFKDGDRIEVDATKGIARKI